jgi:hypothetical protein
MALLAYYSEGAGLMSSIAVVRGMHCAGFVMHNCSCLRRVVTAAHTGVVAFRRNVNVDFTTVNLLQGKSSSPSQASVCCCCTT